MRTWIGGGVLAAVTGGGVYFVLAGAGHPSHCGPCLSGACALPGKAATALVVPPAPSVVDVIDVTRVSLPPSEPGRLPFLSFDEPPLTVGAAVPAAEEPGAIVQASYVAPDAIPPAADDAEVAPAPRPTARPRLASAADPF